MTATRHAGVVIMWECPLLDIKMHELNGFALYREIKRLDTKVKICFLKAEETTPYYGAYSDILSSLPANHIIRKPIDNEELMKRINEIITDDTTTLNYSFYTSIVRCIPYFPSFSTWIQGTISKY